MKFFKYLAIISLLFVAVLAITNSCGGSRSSDKKSERYAPYEIIKKVPTETNNKAQLLIYARLDVEKTSKFLIDATLDKIYMDYVDYDGFKHHAIPSHIAVYLYTKGAKRFESNWCAMLSKYPTMARPEISYSDKELNIAINGTMTTPKTKDDSTYLELCSYTLQHGVNFCFLYNELFNVELESIKEADKIFKGVYNKQYYDYQTQLYQNGVKKLFKKYNLEDSLIKSVSYLGSTYCE